jgi:hypothetical protein
MASVLCCYVPDFLMAGACGDQPGWAEQPQALIAEDERVAAATPAAQRCGVQVAMRSQAARLACPNLHLLPLDLHASRAHQAAYLAVLGEWELPVEAQGWGLAYIDLRGVAESRTAVQPLAADLGRRLRVARGEALLPALSWSTSKFTARVGAMQTTPGCMKLVEPAATAAFLADQPINLLPLDPEHLQQLHWLGIRTLGQFARLPAAAIWQRFGARGKLAQQWARGKDSRPVCGAAPTTYPPVTVAFDPPATAMPLVVAQLLASLQPLLLAQQQRMEGVRQLHLACCFEGGQVQHNGAGVQRIGAVEEAQSIIIDFVEPVNQVGRIEAALVQQFGAHPWPGVLASVRWTLLAAGEMVVAQLTLFAEPVHRLVAINEIVEALTGRYGAVFHQARQDNALHPLPERRGRFVDVASLA